MVYKCCVPMCKSGYLSNKEEKVSIFQIPATKIDLYNQLIKLPDRKLTLKDHVCEKHFDKMYVRRKDHWKNPVARPRLTYDAIPTIFPSGSSVKLRVKKTKKSGPPSVSTVTSLSDANFILQPKELSPCDSEDPTVIDHNDDDNGADDFQLIKPTSPEQDSNNSETKEIEEIFLNSPEIDEDSLILFRNILSKKVVINLPKASWSMCWVHKWGQKYLTFLQTVLTNDENTPVVKRKVVIERNLNYKLYIGFIPVTKLDNILPTIPFKIFTERDIETLLVSFDNVDLCEGGPPIVKFPHAHNNDAELDLTTERWRSKYCELIVNGLNQCEACLKFQNKILLSKINRKTCVSPKIRYRKLRSQELRLKQQCLELEETVENLQKKSVNLSNQMLITQLSTMGFSSLQRQLIEESIKMNETPRCYSEDWLFTCTVLYKCNPEAYSFMWKSDLFPLPSPGMIKKLGSSLLGDNHSLKMTSAQDEMDPLVY